MKLMINGEPQELSCKTLGGLLEALGHTPDSVATAVNGEFVAMTERGTHVLTADDTVEIIAPMAGG